MKRSAPLQRKTPLRRTPWNYRPKPRDKRPRRLRSTPHVINPGLKQAVRVRAQDRCDWCGTWLGTQFDAHHRQLRSRDGVDSLENLAALHRACHGYIHEHPAEATSRGFMVASWQTPADIPVLLTDGRVCPPDETWVDVEEILP